MLRGTAAHRRTLAAELLRDPGEALTTRLRAKADRLNAKADLLREAATDYAALAASADSASLADALRETAADREALADLLRRRARPALTLPRLQRYPGIAAPRTHPVPQVPPGRRHGPPWATFRAKKRPAGMGRRAVAYPPPWASGAGC